MAGAMKWNALAEIVHDQDVDQLARSLIPDGGDPDHTWTEHARTFFIAVTQQALRAKLQDDAELHRLLTKAPVEELRSLLTGTSAAPLLEPGNDRMFGSVRGTIITAVRVLGVHHAPTGSSVLSAKLDQKWSSHVCWRQGWGALSALQGRPDCGTSFDHLGMDANRNL